MDQKIALTQRVDINPATKERRDCLDQRWAPFLEQLGFGVVPVPNGLKDPVGWFREHNFTGLVLSGGNDLSHLPDANNPSPERDQTETALVEECRQHKIPVVGVCRGLQMVNHILGGSQRRCHNHVATRHALQLAPGADEIWKHAEVNSYHDWGIAADDLADGLQPLCFSEDGMIEAFSSRDQPVWGLMWHPERETPTCNTDQKLFHMMLGNTPR